MLDPDAHHLQTPVLVSLYLKSKYTVSLSAAQYIRLRVSVISPDPLGVGEFITKSQLSQTGFLRISSLVPRPRFAVHWFFCLRSICKTTICICISLVLNPWRIQKRYAALCTAHGLYGLYRAIYKGNKTYFFNEYMLGINSGTNVVLTQ